MSILNMFGLQKQCTIQEAYNAGRDENNFNLLRVLAALMVIVYHSYLFTGQQLNYMHRLSLGSLGVDIFFIISGFLVSGSYLHRNDPKTYIISRFLRIWPALIVNAILTAFIMAPLITTSPLNFSFFTAILKYAYTCVILDYPSSRGLPGVFTGMVYPSMNGPLWTLNYEVTLYCIVGLLGLFQILYSRSRMGKFLIIYTLAYLIFTLSVDSYSDFLRLFTVFFAGIAFQIFKDKIKLTNIGMFIAASLFIAFHYSSFKTVHILPFSLCVAYLVIGFAFLPVKFLHAYNKVGDFSYGLYIYGWPVSHLLQKTFTDPFFITINTIIITTIIAMLSWHLVEKRMLSFKKLYPTAEAESSLYKRVYIAIFILLLFLFLTPIIVKPEWPTIVY